MKKKIDLVDQNIGSGIQEFMFDNNPCPSPPPTNYVAHPCSKLLV